MPLFICLFYFCPYGKRYEYKDRPQYKEYDYSLFWCRISRKYHIPWDHVALYKMQHKHCHWISSYETQWIIYLYVPIYKFCSVYNDKASCYWCGKWKQRDRKFTLCKFYFSYKRIIYPPYNYACKHKWYHYFFVIEIDIFKEVTHIQISKHDKRYVYIHGKPVFSWYNYSYNCSCKTKQRSYWFLFCMIKYQT